MISSGVHNREECLTSICPIKNEPIKYSEVPLMNHWLAQFSCVTVLMGDNFGMPYKHGYGYPV